MPRDIVEQFLADNEELVQRRGDTAAEQNDVPDSVAFRDPR